MSANRFEWRSEMTSKLARPDYLSPLFDADTDLLGSVRELSSGDLWVEQRFEERLRPFSFPLEPLGYDPPPTSKDDGVRSAELVQAEEEFWDALWRAGESRLMPFSRRSGPIFTYPMLLKKHTDTIDRARRLRINGEPFAAAFEYCVQVPETASHWLEALDAMWEGAQTCAPRLFRIHDHPQYQASWVAVQNELPALRLLGCFWSWDGQNGANEMDRIVDRMTVMGTAIPSTFEDMFSGICGYHYLMLGGALRPLFWGRDLDKGSYRDAQRLSQIGLSTLCRTLPSMEQRLSPTQYSFLRRRLIWGVQECFPYLSIPSLDLRLGGLMLNLPLSAVDLMALSLEELAAYHQVCLNLDTPVAKAGKHLCLIIRKARQGPLTDVDTIRIFELATEYVDMLGAQCLTAALPDLASALLMSDAPFLQVHSTTLRRSAWRLGSDFGSLREVLMVHPRGLQVAYRMFAPAWSATPLLARKEGGFTPSPSTPSVDFEAVMDASTDLTEMAEEADSLSDDDDGPSFEGLEWSEESIQESWKPREIFATPVTQTPEEEAHWDRQFDDDVWLGSSEEQNELPVDAGSTSPSGNTQPSQTPSTPAGHNRGKDRALQEFSFTGKLSSTDPDLDASEPRLVFDRQMVNGLRITCEVTRIQSGSYNGGAAIFVGFIVRYLNTDDAHTVKRSVINVRVWNLPPHLAGNALAEATRPALAVPGVPPSAVRPTHLSPINTASSQGDPTVGMPGAYPTASRASTVTPTISPSASYTNVASVTTSAPPTSAPPRRGRVPFFIDHRPEHIVGPAQSDLETIQNNLGGQIGTPENNALSVMLNFARQVSRQHTLQVHSEVRVELHPHRPRPLGPRPGPELYNVRNLLNVRARTNPYHQSGFNEIRVGTVVMTNARPFVLTVEVECDCKNSLHFHEWPYRNASPLQIGHGHTLHPPNEQPIGVVDFSCDDMDWDSLVPLLEGFVPVPRGTTQ